jgi:hypothetical protein
MLKILASIDKMFIGISKNTFALQRQIVLEKV